jgi:hypothetical protein
VSLLNDPEAEALANSLGLELTRAFVDALAVWEENRKAGGRNGDYVRRWGLEEREVIAALALSIKSSGPQHGIEAEDVEGPMTALLADIAVTWLGIGVCLQRNREKGDPNG